MATQHARVNLAKDSALQAKLTGLSNYAKQHGLRRDADLIRVMIDAGYDSLRRQELREAIADNQGAEDADLNIGWEAALACAEEEDRRS